jgi:hypothetical protein
LYGRLGSLTGEDGAGDGGQAVAETGGLLEGVGGAEDESVVPVAVDELEADGLAGGECRP